MAHFAKVKDGKVETVIVAEQGFVDQLPGRWVKTSYNTRNGKHAKGGTPLRENFAGIGFIYDEALDAFFPPEAKKTKECE